MNKPAHGRIGWSEVIFSLKTFLASMLALWIACEFGLAKPYWAMATVYIVSQPLSGAVTSKALYRVGGTFLGALITLVLVPKLVNAPALLCLALALWVGFCLFISLLDRTPRSYLFMLAGYTAAIIGFAGVNNPELIFDTASSRVQEITLGIVCAAVVSRVIFPRHVGPVLTGRIEAWLGDAGQWAQDVLSGQAKAGQSRADARRMAADTIGLVALAAYLPYDTSSHKQAREQLNILEQHMTALVPLLSAVGDRITALQADARGLPAPLQALLTDISNWIAAGREGREATAKQLQLEISRLEKSVESRSGWRDLLQFNLCARLRNLVDVWEDCLVLRQAIATGNGRTPGHLNAAARFAGEPVLHLDARVAWISGLAATAGILICCAFWIGTGWNEGGNAAQLTAVFCCIFSSLDNPVPTLKKHTWCLVAAIGIATVYQFAIFPAVDGFPLLVLVLSPFLLAGGAFMATPILGFPAFALCVNSILFLNLESSLNLDFQFFLNNNLAAVIAGVLAIVVVTMFRAIGAEEGVVKLLRSVWADVAQLTSRREAGGTPAFVRRMVDRLGLLVPRLVALPAGSHLHASDMLSDIRVGLNIADLQRERAGLSANEIEITDSLLGGLSRHFRDKLADAKARPSPLLLTGIDDAIARLATPRDRSPAGTTLLHALVGLRRCLFPSARFFEPGLSKERPRS
ncbi:MAG: FUSC family protein [Verrucomicrobiae bacterium]|nr:FUSC family protein [Verrucomicrobiae bacterium]